MVLRSLRLHSFRAHASTELAFAPGVNLLYGPNGAGKTNILEAIHYLCLSKSFVASQDTYALRKGCPYFEVEGGFEGEQRSELTARIAYVPEEGKRLFVNGAALPRLSEIIGLLPVVVFSPEDHALTAGGPDERRKLLNNILSQAHPVYLDDVLKYRRALKQRNELLHQYRRQRGGPPASLLDSWNAELVLLGSRVIARRLHFVATFTAFLRQAYELIEAVAEEPSIEYVGIGSLAPEADEAEISARFEQRLRRAADREQAMGRTLIGPHRDELIFRLDDFEVRRFASQGQHRTFSMALKLAQFLYLRDRLDETPMLLLDDVFGNLDPTRSQGFLELLQSDTIGQSFITATQRGPFAEVVDFGAAEHQALNIVQGQVATPAVQM